MNIIVHDIAAIKDVGLHVVVLNTWLLIIRVI